MWRNALLITVGCFVASGCATEPLDRLEISVSLDRPSFVVGDVLRITIAARNAGDEPVTVRGSSGCILRYQLFDVNDPPRHLQAPYGCTDDLVGRTLAPGQTLTEIDEWRGETRDTSTMRLKFLAPGRYRVRGLLDAVEGQRPSAMVVVELLAVGP